MLTESKKEFVKKRVKAQVKKHWGKTFEELIPDASKRFEIYKAAWALREKQGSAIPKAKLIILLILYIGHWDNKGRGVKVPQGSKQNYHPTEVTA